jgi:hypothetical protein
MAVDIGRYIFPMGSDMLLEIESDAPSHILDLVQSEAEEMSPAMMNWSNSIPIHLDIVKETESVEYYLQEKVIAGATQDDLQGGATRMAKSLGTRQNA